MSEIERKLVLGRECGECSACCISLRIEDAALKKYSDVPCPKLIAGTGCSVYKSRPQVCRTWHCEWRFMAQLDDSWRPDRSEIIIKLHSGESGGLVIQPLGKPSEILTSEKVLRIVCAYVEKEVPIYISVPTKPGRCHALLHLNIAFKNAAASRVFEAAQLEMLKALKHAYQFETVPVIPLEEST